MLKKFKIDTDELNLMHLPEKYSALKVAEQIVLPSKSNFSSKIDLNLTPYSKLPIFCIGKEQIFWIIVVAPTQSGKTVCLQVAVADTIDQSPCTAIYCLPDEKSGQKALEDKVIGMIKSSPFLAKYIKDSERTSLSKVAIRLKNMTIYPAWSNSLASMSSIPAGRVFIDEARLFKMQIGKESNAIKLLTDRMTTFRALGLAQGYIVSTPSEEGDLLHQQLSVNDTQILFYYSQCPSCKKYQILEFFTNVKDDGKCYCTYCDGEFRDNDKKMSWNNKGQYGYKGQDGQETVYLVEGSDVTEDMLISQTDSVVNPLPSRVAFRYSSLVSPFRPFKMIWEEFLATKDNINDYKNFIQAWLAEFWQNTKSKLDRSYIEDRITDIPKYEVPQGTLVICGGVDVQDDGFYVSVRAFGKNMESWLIDAFFIPSKMNIVTEDNIFDAFKDLIEDRVYETIDGVAWKIAHWTLDSLGHRTAELYPALARLERVFKLAGRNNQPQTIMPSGNIDNLYLVRTDEYLQETEEACQRTNFHFHKGFSDDYITQWLNSAKTEEVRKDGTIKISWVKLGQNDIRMSDIFTFITMDIAISKGTSLRQCTGIEGWSLNPIMLVERAKNSESDLTVNQRLQKEVHQYDEKEENGGYF